MQCNMANILCFHAKVCPGVVLELRAPALCAHLLQNTMMKREYLFMCFGGVSLKK